MSWDYFDIGLFEFDSGYVEAIEAIVEAEGRFHLSISSTVLKHQPILLQMSNDICMLMIDSGWLNTYKDQNVQNMLFNDYITGASKNAEEN